MPNTSELLSEIMNNVGEIVRGEVQLAKAEMKEEASKAARAGAMAGAGAVLAWFGFGFFLLTIMYGLTGFLPVWGAALAVAVVLLGGAAILLTMGRNRMRQIHPKPDRAISHTREDVEWIRKRT
jgi:uncharacterized membrane protein YqjE